MKKLLSLVILLSLVLSANAELKFQQYSEQVFEGETYLMDIDQDGVNDFRFRVTQASSYEIEILDTDKQIEVLSANSNLAAVLSQGVPIGNNAWNPAAQTIFLTDFLDQGDRYIGIRDVSGTGENIGWVSLFISSGAGIVLQSSGFEDEGVAIETGEIFIEPVGVNENNWKTLGLNVLQQKSSFTITNSSTESFQLVVMNVSGKQVASTTLSNSATISDLLPGMYIATVIDPRSKSIAATRKVMVY